MAALSQEGMIMHPVLIGFWILMAFFGLGGIGTIALQIVQDHVASQSD